MNTTSFPSDPELIKPDNELIVANHSGYGYDDSSNYEHDDTGDIHNYSGCQDIIWSAESEHCGWEDGYDYQS